MIMVIGLRSIPAAKLPRNLAIIEAIVGVALHRLAYAVPGITSALRQMASSSAPAGSGLFQVEINRIGADLARGFEAGVL